MNAATRSCRTLIIQKQLSAKTRTFVVVNFDDFAPEEIFEITRDLNKMAVKVVLERSELLNQINAPVVRM